MQSRPHRIVQSKAPLLVPEYPKPLNMVGGLVQQPVVYSVAMLIYQQKIHPVMVFRRFNKSLRPVNRIKHVVDKQLSLTAGTAGEEFIIQAKDAPVLANTTEVQTGATVNAIYLKVEATATSSAVLPNMYIYIWKNPGGNLTKPTANAVGASDNKKYVIHQEMIMFQKQDGSNPRTLFNGVIVIPRGYRRFAPNDTLNIVLLTPGITADVCFQSHYKEFR